jgi:hypothetical protein
VITIQATPAAGAAPLHVTFAAAGDAASYHWDFGDGGAAEGRTAEHTYAAGRWTATLTARSSAGEATSQSAVVSAYGLTLAAPNPVRYGRRVVLRGALVPAEQGLRIALAGPQGNVSSTRTRADGSYAFVLHVKRPAEYRATSDRAGSAPLALHVVPKLVAGLTGSSTRDSPLFFTARVVPADAGALAVNVARGQDVLVDRTFTGGVRITSTPIGSPRI